jgi:hypothetical protein
MWKLFAKGKWIEEEIKKRHESQETFLNLIFDKTSNRAGRDNNIFNNVFNANDNSASPKVFSSDKY